MKQYVLSVLVQNDPGVLLRVVGLFSRRGYNINSLNVAETEFHDKSRMTIVVSGDLNIVEQIEKQLLKLVDVMEVQLLSNNAVCREQLLIVAGKDSSSRQGMIEIANLFRAKIVDVAEISLMFELTGEPEKIDSFINLLKPFTIRKLVRTGISALERTVADTKLQ